MDHEFVPITPPRLLNSDEEAILQFLLSADFQGREQLLKQAKSARVIEKCQECLSLIIFVDKLPETIADVKRRVPVHAQGVDLDGGIMQILLHVVHGYLDEIEIYRVDFESVKGMPKPNLLKFIGIDDEMYI
jgi:hypothetical protein